MQPYLFPYLGYYQMVNHVDKFVFLDDVNYIKKGWINRNTTLVGGKETYFTVPLKKASQNKKINETLLADTYPLWRGKFLKSIHQNYKKSKNFENTFRVIEEVLYSQFSHISQLAAESVIRSSEELNIDTEFLFSSQLKCSGKKEEKIMNICKELGANEYINAPGGRHLYSKKDFFSHKIDLKFIQPELKYPSYSLLHYLFYDQAIEQLPQYQIE